MENTGFNATFIENYFNETKNIFSDRNAKFEAAVGYFGSIFTRYNSIYKFQLRGVCDNISKVDDTLNIFFKNLSQQVGLEG